MHKLSLGFQLLPSCKTEKLLPSCLLIPLFLIVSVTIAFVCIFQQRSVNLSPDR